MSFPAFVTSGIDGLMHDAQAGPHVRAVLDWLALPAASRIAEEAAALSAHLDVLDQAAVLKSARVRILDVFHDRARACSRALKPELAASALPVDHSLRTTAETLCSLHMRLAQAYLAALTAGAAHRPARTASHAMVSVLAAYSLNVLIAADGPPHLWGTANALLMRTRTATGSVKSRAGSVDADQLYRQLVALALTQPAHLTPAEFFSVAEYVRSYSGAVQIQVQPPHRDLDSWFWLDDEIDQGPAALLRTPIDAARAEHVFYCSCQRLGQVLGQHLDQIDEGSSAGELHLPACLEHLATRGLMRRLQSRWMSMPRRQQARRERQQHVHMLIGFDPIWTLLERRDPSTDWETHSAHWIVQNDGTHGFALSLASSQTGLVRPGTPVLIKGRESRNWMICVVRWARSRRAHGVEIGVELLSHGAQAATVVFGTEGSTSGRTPVAALRLPPLASRRPLPALMLQTGTASGRDMLIAHAAGDRLRLGEARLSDLSLQTHAFDLFELEELPAA
jgi:hypothetical protein